MDGSRTDAITAEVFAGWCDDTLKEWTPGYTDWLAALGGQFRIKLVTDAGDATGSVYEVATIRGDDPRRFRVTVAVEEIIHADN